jgi:hypothetical protein
MTPDRERMYPDVAALTRERRLEGAGFGASDLKRALRATRRNLRCGNHDGELRAADQVYKLSGVYAPTENKHGGGPSIVIVNAPNFAALFLQERGQLADTASQARDIVDAQ